MNKEFYKNILGCVVSYKSFYEPLLFNELHTKCAGLKLLDRGKSTAAFTDVNYLKMLSVIHTDGFVFLQHIHPFMSRCEISGNIADFSIFTNMLESVIPYLTEKDKIVCQCRIDTHRKMDYTNNELLTLFLSRLEKEGYTAVPQEAQIAISLTVFDHTAYLGISQLKDNISERSGGILYYSKTEDIISRAEFKIEEAFKTFGIDVIKEMKALDLGAAPGGWTHYLSLQGVAVDAVDPANMNEVVLCSPNVKHYKMTAQEFIIAHPEKIYDIIVNDMKMDTNESLEILCQMSNQLKKEGGCLLTLKLPKKEVQKRINTARKMLKDKFEIVKIRQLYYNRSEVTVFAKNRL